MVDAVVVVNWLDSLQESLAPYPGAYLALMLSALVIAAGLANWVTKRILLRGLRRLLARLPGADSGRGSNVMRVISRLSNVVPSQVIASGIAYVPDLPVGLVAFVVAACQAWAILTVSMALSHALDAANDLYERRPDARNKPIKGYLQVAKIVIFAIAGLAIVATLAGVELRYLVTGLGAATAVLMLIFQDTILSLVASVQISGDGRIRLGDWIEMPSQNADGDVIDIALHTVTVQNFDKTITTIPTKKLVTESFKNWRGMQESGGRRIKRALFLDQHSVGFMDDQARAQVGQFALLADYLRDKDTELGQWNAELRARGAGDINSRRVTNLGTFRAYVERYLGSHPGINPDMTLLVRQLQPTTEGLPLELYCFTRSTAWGEYEGVQSDIFDHLLAILPAFGLRVFQASSDAMLMEARAERAQQPPATPSPGML
ncbi:mechanosensitive ion channel protein MscS [Stenotrophomonas sp. Betaine-02u-21]|uniref:mechanosensitive ion channel family protein n=1 Tax=Stenotrophomonas TaxID=40323 RepID=UPI000C3426B9|nr:MULTISPECIES: mechanosensitive ion channel domain-containing protein [Stenotrophomonas]PKH72469.1 mechanosensitive ion channel protein MscS [Stenotrophomonas sp. Betaine-02u-21]PKH73387.1 mechanosensitive ion channel protein MscS [Stenotrophomonas sp. Betaine-02u-23]PKH97323.1 mechanosensitive ion channel protein MscS [Stenotrophomonas sp. Bg11-02]